MMIFVTIVLAIVQGITEFLPISSSAHLLLVPWLFSWPDPGLSFDAAIHVGTAIALLIFFSRDFIELIKRKSNLVKYIVISTIPGAAIGFFGDKWIENNLHGSPNAPLIVGVGMIVFSGVLYMSDKLAKQKLTTADLGFKRSFLIGLAQALALVPGVSRSGITISAGLWAGLKREEAARFSFLLATPISLGAGLYKIVGILKDPTPETSLPYLVLGIIVSALTGLVVIKWLLQYLNKHDMKVFVLYRIRLGIVVLGLYFFVNK